VLVWDDFMGDRDGRHPRDVFFGPDEEREVVNVGVAFEDVGDCVMGVVAFFPPVDGVAGADAANEVGEEVVDTAVFETLLVGEVVSKPSLLLIADANKNSSKDQCPYAVKIRPRTPIPRVSIVL